MRLPSTSRHLLFTLVASTVFAVSSSCAAPAATVTPLKDISSPPLSITLLHVGDTNSYVIPHNIKLNFGGRDILATVGGWSLLMAAVEDIRTRELNTLLLHSGGVIQGTIWTPRFGGMADIDAMNTLQFDALTLGDSEFSGSMAETTALIKRAKFPVLASNMDISHQPSLSGLVNPYTLLERAGQRIGVIGVITPGSLQPGREEYPINVSSPVEAAREYVMELNQQGINKIIVLSHLGYEGDIALAKSVEGIDVIVGGHSATFMGGPEFERIGLKPERQYPAELKGPAGDRVIIVHAWENNQLLGQIKLDFDEKGRISSYQGQPFIPAMNSFLVEDNSSGWMHLCSCQPEFDVIMETMAKNPGIMLYWDNADMSGTLQPYINEICDELNTVVAVADEDLYRGVNSGPGSLIADAFLWSARSINPQVQIAVYESSKVRSDIFRGNILSNDIHMLVPFRQSISIMTVYGFMLKTILEKGIDYCMDTGMQPPFFEIAGLGMAVDLSRPGGQRITSLKLQNADGSYIDMHMDGCYTLAADTGFAERSITGMLDNVRWTGPLFGVIKKWFKAYVGFCDTGIRDTDALTDYLKVQKHINNRTEERVSIVPASSE